MQIKHAIFQSVSLIKPFNRNFMNLNVELQQLEDNREDFF